MIVSTYIVVSLCNKYVFYMNVCGPRAHNNVILHIRKWAVMSSIIVAFLYRVPVAVKWPSSKPEYLDYNKQKFDSVGVKK